VLTSQQLKNIAREYGADLVGIGDIDRFEGVAKENDPKFIAPAAKSIICLGFRVLRGALRGIEEGTQFYQYPEMGVVHLDEIYGPSILRRVACFLEDNGYEGVVQRAITDRRPASDKGVNPERASIHKIAFAEPVSPEKPAPDVLMDFKLGAYVCGMGEIGMGGFFLTPQFGPLQRFAFILTDAPLDPDPVYDGPALCDNCGKCIDACPGKAISKNEKVALNLNSFQLEHAKLDEWQCSAYYIGANTSTNPFLEPDALKSFDDCEQIAKGEKILNAEKVKALKSVLGAAYPGVRFDYNASICGRACYRACLVALEERGVLTHKFHSPFRGKPVWKLSK